MSRDFSLIDGNTNRADERSNAQGAWLTARLKRPELDLADGVTTNQRKKQCDSGQPLKKSAEPARPEMPHNRTVTIHIVAAQQRDPGSRDVG